MDFGGGIQKGNYKTYPGSYLEVASRAGAVAAGGGRSQAYEKVKSTLDVRRRPQWYGRKRSPRRTRAGSLDRGWGTNAIELRAYARRNIEKSLLEIGEGQKGGARAGAGAGVGQKQGQLQGQTQGQRQTQHLRLRQALAAAGRGMGGESDSGEASAASPDDPSAIAGNDLDGVYRSMHDTSNEQRLYDVKVDGLNSRGKGRGGGRGGGGSGGGGGDDMRFAEHKDQFGGSKTPKRETKKEPVGGKYGFNDKDRSESSGEKSDEYAYMYKNFMDAMDDTCYRDLPKKWLSGCQSLYKKGDQLVEMYLHDYDDWEICTEVQPACKSAKMFESLGAVKAL
jgi:hypothetical protein